MTGPQAPSIPCPFTVVEQAWQSPVQAVLQQTPSTQKVLKQFALIEQMVPVSDLHAPTPSHDCDAPEQVPTSSWPAVTFEQVPTVPVRLQAWHVVVQALLQQTPSTQLPLKHSTVLAQPSPISFLQTPMPSQDWFTPEHVLTSSWPEGTFEQVPTVPIRLQDLQLPLQSALQQTPSKH
jgi:hypothetical protein